MIKSNSLSDLYTEEEINTFNLKFYNPDYQFSKGKFYNSSIIDEYGINYSNWFKLYHNIGDVIQKVSNDSFKLLLTLVCHPHTQGCKLLKISVKSLLDRLKIIKTSQIKKQLESLIINKYIIVKNFNGQTRNTLDNLKFNDDLYILILYNNNLIASAGYKPIPIDYFNGCLLNLTSVQCSIMCILIDKFTYYTTKVIYDSESNQTVYRFKVCEYAFPSLDVIGVWLKKDRRTIKNNIIELAELNVLSFGIHGNKSTYGNKEMHIVNPNYIYRVKLLQRIEYQYFYNYLFSQYDNRSEKEIKYVRSHLTCLLTSSDYERVKQYDFPSGSYEFKDFEKAIKFKDVNFYENQLSVRYVIPSFDNASIKIKK